MNFRPHFSKYLEPKNEINTQQQRKLQDYRFAAENQAQKYTTPLGFQTQQQYQAPPQASMHNPDYFNPIPNNNQFDNFEKMIDMSKFNTTNQQFEKFDEVRILDTQQFKEQFAVQNAANQFDALSPIHTRTNQQHYTGMQPTARQQNRQSNFK